MRKVLGWMNNNRLDRHPRSPDQRGDRFEGSLRRRVGGGIPALCRLDHIRPDACADGRRSPDPGRRRPQDRADPQMQNSYSGVAEDFLEMSVTIRVSAGTALVSAMDGRG